MKEFHLLQGFLASLIVNMNTLKISLQGTKGSINLYINPTLVPLKFF